MMMDTKWWSSLLTSMISNQILVLSMSKRKPRSALNNLYHPIETKKENLPIILMTLRRLSCQSTKKQTLQRNSYPLNLTKKIKRKKTFTFFTKMMFYHRINWYWLMNLTWHLNRAQLKLCLRKKVKLRSRS